MVLAVYLSVASFACFLAAAQMNKLTKIQDSKKKKLVKEVEAERSMVVDGEPGAASSLSRAISMDGSFRSHSDYEIKFAKNRSNPILRNNNPCGFESRPTMCFVFFTDRSIVGLCQGCWTAANGRARRTA